MMAVPKAPVRKKRASTADAKNVSKRKLILAQAHLGASVGVGRKLILAHPVVLQGRIDVIHKEMFCLASSLHNFRRDNCIYENNNMVKYKDLMGAVFQAMDKGQRGEECVKNTFYYNLSLRRAWCNMHLLVNRGRASVKEPGSTTALLCVHLPDELFRLVCTFLPLLPSQSEVQEMCDMAGTTIGATFESRQLARRLA
jgi:hypothetical protein